jgi:hypothetical protein
MLHTGLNLNASSLSLPPGAGFFSPFIEDPWVVLALVLFFILWSICCLFHTLRWRDVELKTTSSEERFLEYTERAPKTRTGVNNDSRSFPPKMFEDKGINI